MKNIFTILIAIVCINVKAQVCFTSTNYPVGYGNTTIACADFNSDGNLDLVVASDPEKNLYMLLGNGLGGFGTSTLLFASLDSLVPFLECIISKDYNEDGNADLAVAESGDPGVVQILFGDGTGNFPTTNSFIVGSYPVSICSADFNGDGNVDIATANDGTHDVSILLGDGTGNFSNHTDFPVSYNPAAICSGDFNGDSIPDLAVVSNNGSGTDSVWVLLGNGAGNFGVASEYSTGTGSFSVCGKDFDGDSFDDIAVANSNSNNVSVLLSQGASGLFFPAFNYTAGNGSYISAPFSVASDDFNLDGKPDLAVANFYQSIVCILLNIGSGSFGPLTYYPAPYGPWTIISADFNSDGKPDLATTDHDSPEITVLLNCSMAGIDNFIPEQDYSIFPNPTNSSFTLNVLSTAKQIKILNSLGQIVQNTDVINQTKFVFEIENSGIYFIQITTNKEVTTEKLIVAQ